MKKITEWLGFIVLCVWVERNMALPWVGHWVQLPWVFVEGGLGASILFNLGLLSVFAFVYSHRLTLLALLVLLAGWQRTGIILYQAIPSAQISSALSIILFVALLVTATRMGTRRRADFCVFAAFLVTPLLSLDRLVFVAGMAVYLLVENRRKGGARTSPFLFPLRTM
jgi:hypothetical protein